MFCLLSMYVKLYWSHGKGNNFSSHHVCWNLHGDIANVIDAVAKATIAVRTSCLLNIAVAKATI